MKFCLPIPHTLRLKATLQPWEAAVTGAEQTRVMKLADQLGYDMINVPEHFLIPTSHVDLSGPHYFDATAAQGYITGATQHVRVGTSLTILPLHHPVVLAKALATIDWLSSGRVVVTFGVGWLKEEFDAMGVPFSKRGRMSDEYLAAIIELWTKDAPCFEGEYISFRDVAFEPKPVQKPHIPIWMGGDSDAALRRTARFACGWIPFLTKPEDFPARIDFIKSQPDYSAGSFEVLFNPTTLRIGEGHVVRNDQKGWPGTSAQEIADRLGWLGELGVTTVVAPIPPVDSLEAYLEQAQWIIEEVKPRL